MADVIAMKERKAWAVIDTATGKVNVTCGDLEIHDTKKDAQCTLIKGERIVRVKITEIRK